MDLLLDHFQRSGSGSMQHACIESWREDAADLKGYPNTLPPFSMLVDASYIRLPHNWVGHGGGEEQDIYSYKELL